MVELLSVLSIGFPVVSIFLYKKNKQITNKLKISDEKVQNGEVEIATLNKKVISIKTLLDDIKRLEDMSLDCNLSNV